MKYPPCAILKLLSDADSDHDPTYGEEEDSFIVMSCSLCNDCRQPPHADTRLGNESFVPASVIFPSIAITIQRHITITTTSDSASITITCDSASFTITSDSASFISDSD